jgi:hypothetical protein
MVDPFSQPMVIQGKADLNEILLEAIAQKRRDQFSPRESETIE